MFFLKLSYCFSELLSILVVQIDGLHNCASDGKKPPITLMDIQNPTLSYIRGFLQRGRSIAISQPFHVIECVMHPLFHCEMIFYLTTVDHQHTQMKKVPSIPQNVPLARGQKEEALMCKLRGAEALNGKVL